MSRFVNPKNRESEALFLPLTDEQKEKQARGEEVEPDYIVIKTRLTNREQRQIDAAGVKVAAAAGEKVATVSMDVVSLDFEKVSVMLLDWSLTNDAGEKVQLNRDNLTNLDDSSFKEIVSAIDAWQEEREQEKNATPPETGELQTVN